MIRPLDGWTSADNREDLLYRAVGRFLQRDPPWIPNEDPPDETAQSLEEALRSYPKAELGGNRIFEALWQVLCEARKNGRLEQVVSKLVTLNRDMANPAMQRVIKAANAFGMAERLAVEFQGRRDPEGEFMRFAACLLHPEAGLIDEPLYQRLTDQQAGTLGERANALAAALAEKGMAPERLEPLLTGLVPRRTPG